MSSEQPTVESSNAEQKEPSKSALKKAEKDKKKAEQKAARQQSTQQQQQQKSSQEVDVSAGNYGNAPLIQSQSRPGRTFTNVKDLNASLAEKSILIRGRVHSSRGKGNLCFLVIRQRMHSVQVVISKGDQVSKAMVNFASSISSESIVDIEGVVVVPKEKIEATTQKDVEVNVLKIFIVSSSAPLPLVLEDLSRPMPILKAQSQQIKKIQAQIDEIVKSTPKDATEEQKKKIAQQVEELTAQKVAAQKYVKVERDVRLNNRIIDLRTQANQAIFRLQSGVCMLFREFLLKNSFTEIHTPKMLGAASEGGANVFKVQYFDGSAFLAQSPQLYKQMCICADMERVFEIGPVFRAENSFTHRHLTEFTGLDLEMSFNEHYHEVLDVLEGLFLHIFEGIPSKFGAELQIISQQYPFEPFKVKGPVLRLRFPDAVKMLKEDGVEIAELEDLSTPQEKHLGKLVKAKYDTDFYMLDKFPTNARPFYTMPDPEDPRYSNSYDFFMRGEEIMSGAQRVHVPELLEKRATECGVALNGIKDYIDSFRFGAPPHGGGGVGLERVVMLYLGLKNIRLTSMYPRDPKRLHP